MKRDHKSRSGEAERAKARNRDQADKSSLLSNQKSVGSGDSKTTVYPKKMGYHGSDREKDLNPEE